MPPYLMQPDPVWLSAPCPSAVLGGAQGPRPQWPSLCRNEAAIKGGLHLFRMKINPVPITLPHQSIHPTEMYNIYASTSTHLITDVLCYILPLLCHHEQRPPTLLSVLDEVAWEHRRKPAQSRAENYGVVVKVSDSPTKTSPFE